MEFREWVCVAAIVVSLFVSVSGWVFIVLRDNRVLRREVEREANNVVLEFVKVARGDGGGKPRQIWWKSLKPVGPGHYEFFIGEDNPSYLCSEEEMEYDMLYWGEYRLKNVGTGVAFNVELSGVSVIGENFFHELMPGSYKPVSLIFESQRPAWFFSTLPNEELVVSYGLHNGARKRIVRMMHP